jgi:hypothetical protein
LSYYLRFLVVCVVLREPVANKIKYLSNKPNGRGGEALWSVFPNKGNKWNISKH